MELNPRPISEPDFKAPALLPCIRRFGHLTSALAMPGVRCRVLQMVALDQVTEMPFQGVAAGPGGPDGLHHRDAPVLAGELHDLQ